MWLERSEQELGGTSQGTCGWQERRGFDFRLMGASGEEGGGAALTYCLTYSLQGQDQQLWIITYKGQGKQGDTTLSPPLLPPSGS